MGGVSLKNVPNAVWYCLTLSFLGILATFIVLSNNGSDPTEFRSFLNTILNIVGGLVGGTSAVFAGIAAKNSQDTKEQTNGQLDQRIATAVASQLVAHGNPLNKTEVTDNGRPTL